MMQDAHEFLQRTISEQPTTKFCIEVNGVAVGGIGIRLGQDVHRQTAGLGYWLGEGFWGRGIMTEAVGAFSDSCFEDFPLRRIYAEAFANNPASAHVLEKPVLFSKAVSRTTSSRAESFSIHSSTPRQSRSLVVVVINRAATTRVISRLHRTSRPPHRGPHDRSRVRAESS